MIFLGDNVFIEGAENASVQAQLVLDILIYKSDVVLVAITLQSSEKEKLSTSDQNMVHESTAPEVEKHLYQMVNRNLLENSE